MTGVAAYLASLDHQIAHYLVPTNALSLIRAGVEPAFDVTRELLVSELLDKSAIGEIDIDWGVDLKPLVHPGLAEQLQNSLEDQRAPTPEQLWWISRLSSAGSCYALAERLLRWGLEAEFPTWSRRSALTAAVELQAPFSEELRELLHLGPEHDPGDELLGIAIDSFYPTYINISDVLEALRPRRATSLIGGYFMALSRLVDRVPPEDLHLLVGWASSHAFDASIAYGQLFPRLLARSGTRVRDEKTRTALANLLVRMAEASNWDLQVLETTIASLQDRDTRLQLAVDVARHPDCHITALLDTELVQEPDVEWLLANLPKLPTDAHCALSRCIPYLIGNPTALVADQILNLNPLHPAYPATESLRGSVDVNSELYVHVRKHLAAKLRRVRAAQRVEGRRRGQLMEALSTTGSDPARWWTIPVLMTTDDSINVGAFNHDITRRPGWSWLTLEQRELFYRGGVEYLVIHNPRPQEWIRLQESSSEDVLPDWTGVYFLTTLARHRPELLKYVDSSIWTKWGISIFAAGYNDHEGSKLRAVLISSALPSTQSALADVAEQYLEMCSNWGIRIFDPSILSPLRALMSSRLSAHLATGLYAEPVRSQALELVASWSPGEAARACRALFASHDEGTNPSILRVWAQSDPLGLIHEMGWNEVKKELITLSPHIDLGALSDEELTKLAELHLEALPYQNDPPLRSGLVTAEDEARRKRDQILQTLASRGLTSELISLRKGRDQTTLEILAYIARTSHQYESDRNFYPVEPASLLHLFRRADARLVRSADDLTSVLVEKLEEIQDEISQQGAFRDIWNFVNSKPTDPKSEDDISDYLQRQLKKVFTTDAVIDREVQVARLRTGGIGTKIDLTATSTSRCTAGSEVRVIVEAKLVSNSGLLTAIRDQLVDRYLRPLKLEHGLYLVYWVNPGNRPQKWKGSIPQEKSVLLSELEEISRRTLPDYHIRVFILDISPSA